MMYLVHIMNTNGKEDSLTLSLLQAIDKQSNVTQRHLADRLGVALGLANSYLKRCVTKGLVKIEQAPANRYLYYLTPKGFTEKSRLTAEYLSISFGFYRRASASCSEVFQQCINQNIHNIILCGISELAEIAILRSREFNINIIGFIDRESSEIEYLGYPVWKSPMQNPEYDAYIITSLQNPEAMLDYINVEDGEKTIFVPAILGVQNLREKNVE
jgi:DNA-binding MarR family transcriptional regulator